MKNAKLQAVIRFVLYLIVFIGVFMTLSVLDNAYNDWVPLVLGISSLPAAFLLGILWKPSN